MKVFDYEAQMKPLVRTWMEARGLQVKEEFPCDGGICDLVGCEFRQGAAEARLSEGQREPIGPLRRVHLWHYIPNDTEHRTASMGELVAVFRGVLGAKVVEEELTTLEERAFIRCTRAGTYQKINGWHPLHSQLVSVEMKLKDWRAAQRQACRHLTYADESYVALPRDTAEIACKESERRSWKATGVGLLAISDLCGAEIIITSDGRCKRTRAQMAHQTYAAERFWRDAVKGKSA